MTPEQETDTPDQEIDAAYKQIKKVLLKLTRGDGETRDTREARQAYAALQIVRQWARVGAAVERGRK